MQIGQRLKQARLDAGLSQRQLCGEQITRNMLSQIENGSARPSMDTLAYLAKELGKPLSFFLEEDTQNPGLPSALQQARQYYLQGEFAQAITLLSDIEPAVAPEGFLLLALCRMALAKQAISQGQQKYAQKLLEKTAEDGSQTFYYTPALERERLLLLYQADPAKAKVLWDIFPKDSRPFLLQAQSALENQQPADAVRILEADDNRCDQWHLLRGLAAMETQDFPTAISCLGQAETEFPDTCIPALEVCYRETGDYKMAYTYACKQK